MGCKVNKKYLLYWGNILLLAVNIAFVVVLLLQREAEKLEIDHTISSKFLQRELNFTPEQNLHIMGLDSLIQRRYYRILSLLSQERYHLLEELAKPEPSPEVINRIANSVGRLHRGMKIQTARHLINVKQVCTPEQAKKLEDIFKELIEIERTNLPDKE